VYRIDSAKVAQARQFLSAFFPPSRLSFAEKLSHWSKCRVYRALKVEPLDLRFTVLEARLRH
jgi:hypothetical protein